MLMDHCLNACPAYFPIGEGTDVNVQMVSNAFPEVAGEEHGAITQPDDVVANKGYGDRTGSSRMNVCQTIWR